MRENGEDVRLVQNYIPDLDLDPENDRVSKQLASTTQDSRVHVLLKEKGPDPAVRRTWSVDYGRSLRVWCRSISCRCEGPIGPYQACSPLSASNIQRQDILSPQFWRYPPKRSILSHSAWRKTRLSSHSFPTAGSRSGARRGENRGRRKTPLTPHGEAKRHPPKGTCLVGDVFGLGDGSKPGSPNQGIYN